MNVATLVDTDILIDAGRAIDTAIEYLKIYEEKGRLAVSATTVMELILGCRNKGELRQTEKFLQRYQTIYLSTAISERAILLLKEYALSHGLRMGDALIAATAIENGLPLSSKNQRDFQFISNLTLLPYPNPL